MLEQIVQRPVIPIVNLDDADSAIPLAEALLEGGIDIVKITSRTGATAQAISTIREALPDMLVGSGAVLSVERAKPVIDAGACFASSPGLNPKVVNYFKEQGVIFFPSIMTPSEVELALELGCQLQIFFPAEMAGGLNMLKALSEPCNGYDVRFSAFGGVNIHNMNDYLTMPIVANVGAFWIATKQQIAAGDWNIITQQAKVAMAKAKPKMIGKSPQYYQQFL